MVENTIGRPRETAYVQNKIVSIRFSEEELRMVQQEAGREGLTVGRWVRETIRREFNNG
jgi:predicted DNA binding CopG/RHH family protein